MNKNETKRMAPERVKTGVLELEPEALLRAEHLVKHYPAGGGLFSGPKKVLHALDDVSLAVRKGEIFGVVGESGCGKSTLGRCLLRLVEPTGGKIVFEGEDISAKSRRELKPLRRNMQMIFQNPFSSFNPKLSIGSSLLEAGRVHGMSREQTRERIAGLLEEISLPENVLGRGPGELSGGQLQRLAIARALLLSPRFMVADEPVSALDVSVQAQILNLLQDLREKFDMTMLFISHEMTVVEYLCDTVAVMYLGKVVELAPTRELFGNLLHPYTQALMSAIPKADPEADTARIVLQGDLPSAMDVPPGCRFASRCIHRMARCTVEEPPLLPVGGAGHFAACHLLAHH